MTGIIGAMDVEVDALKTLVKNKKTALFAGIEFVSGSINGREVCIAKCSAGKVNAALCTQIMIDRFSPDEIINMGIACSLSENVVIKDVVVATEVCQYDFDTSAIDGVKGLIIDDKTSIPADKDLSDKLAKAAKKCVERVHRGIIASGDCFIASEALKQSIVSDFSAICGEMEGGAVGQVCYINGVPFAVIRSISDGGDENSQIDYPAFKEIAAHISTTVIKAFFSR